MTGWAIGFLSTVLLAVLFTGWMRHYALKRALVDEPGARSSHSVPTPRGGGAAIVVAFLGAIILLWFLSVLSVQLGLALVVGGAAVAAVGFWDDHQGLSARARLAVHVAAAVWALVWLGGVPPVAVGDWMVSLGVMGALLGVFGLVWLLNLFNFMDGIDGIAATEAIFVAGAGAALLWWSGETELAAASALLAAASLGFLLWNLPPARIFMGDVGSGFLGFVLGVLGLAAAHAVPGALWAWIILLGLFIVDATVTLIVRLRHGTRWSEPHRRHVYQRLARRWGSHGRVTGLYTLINMVWLLPWALIAWTFPGWGAAAALGALAPLALWVFLAGAGRPVDEPLERSTGAG